MTLQSGSNVCTEKAVAGKSCGLISSSVPAFAFGGLRKLTIKVIEVCVM
jgi:hypothetical protein